MPGVRSLTVIFDATATKRMARVLDVSAEVVDDLRPVFENVAEKVRGAFEVIFEEEGPGWDELSPATQAQRRRRRERGEITQGDAHDILKQTEELFNSLVDREHASHVEYIGDDEFAYGTVVPYAVYHEYGTANMPAREIINTEILFPAIGEGFTDTLSVEQRRAIR